MIAAKPGNMLFIMLVGDTIKVFFAGVLAFLGHMLDHRIHLRAQQQHRSGDIEVQQQDNDRPDAAVHGVVVGESLDVITEAQGRDDPHHYCQHRTGGNEAKLLLNVGHHVIDQGHRDHHQNDDCRPAQHGPQGDDEFLHADLRGNPLHHLRPQHHQCGSRQEHAGNADGVDHRQRDTLPHRAPFDHVVGGVHRAHHQPHTG
ncbi:hypothetical protein D3C79_721570 [compost metagenome]